MPAATNTNELQLLIKAVYDGTGMKAAERDLRRIGVYGKDMGGGVVKAVNAAGNSVDVMGNSINKLAGTMERSARSFKFGWLGVMFGAMAAERLLSGVLRTASKTYLDIVQGSTEASVAATNLNAAFDYLSYTVGKGFYEAIAPLIPTIISLVEAFGDFIEQHPEVIWLLIAAAIAAIATLTFTQMFGFMQSLRTFAYDTGIAESFGNLASKVFPSLARSTGGVSIASLALLGVIAAVVVGVVALVVALKWAWDTNWMGMRQNTAGFMMFLLDTKNPLGQWFKFTVNSVKYLSGMWDIGMTSMSAGLDGMGIAVQASWMAMWDGLIETMKIALGPILALMKFTGSITQGQINDIMSALDNAKNKTSDYANLQKEMEDRATVAAKEMSDRYIVMQDDIANTESEMQKMIDAYKVLQAEGERMTAIQKEIISLRAGAIRQPELSEANLAKIKALQEEWYDLSKGVPTTTLPQADVSGILQQAYASTTPATTSETTSTSTTNNVTITIDGTSTTTDAQQAKQIMEYIKGLLGTRTNVGTVFG